MKTKILFLIIVVLCPLFIYAQWQNDVRLTNNTAVSKFSYNNAWCLAVSGSYIHVVWMDNRDGNYEIYYKRSTDEGVTWGADTRMTNNTGTSGYPSIAVSGSIVHLVWFDNIDLNEEIYYKRSTDGGANWGTDTRLTNNNEWSEVPSVTAIGSLVQVVWVDNRNGNPEIYHKRSTDNGVSWGADLRLTINTGASWYPCVSGSGSYVHLVWQDDRDGNTEIYYKRSTDGGGSWSADTRLTTNSSDSEFPSVSVSGSAVHVVWVDLRDGNREIYYKRSADNGENWGADTRFTNNTATSRFPTATASGSLVHVVWEDNRDANYEIYYKRSTDSGISWSTDTRLTNLAGTSYHPYVAVSGTIVHVVWYDGRDNNDEIYYKRNPTGNVVDVNNIGNEIPDSYKLYQNYPNPFNPVTKIRFTLREEGKGKKEETRLIIYDILGKEVHTLVNEQLSPGMYEVTFDGADFPSGIYFYQLRTENFIETKKLVLLK